MVREKRNKEDKSELIKAETRAGIIGEICVCGHLRSEHTSIAVSSRDELRQKLEPSGHGCCSKCKCLQFTWKAFLFDKSSKGWKEKE